MLTQKFPLKSMCRVCPRREKLYRVCPFRIFHLKACVEYVGVEKNCVEYGRIEKSCCVESECVECMQCQVLYSFLRFPAVSYSYLRFSMIHKCFELVPKN